MSAGGNKHNTRTWGRDWRGIGDRGLELARQPRAAQLAGLRRLAVVPTVRPISRSCALALAAMSGWSLE